MKRFETHGEEETIDLGRRIAATLPKRAVVLLIGNLGAGKTTLAKGIISGLGAAEPEDVTSPTFTLIHEYGDARVYHIDLYRLDRAEQVATLGPRRNLRPRGRGADRVGRALPAVAARRPHRDSNRSPLNEDSRRIEIAGHD